MEESFFHFIRDFFVKKELPVQKKGKWEKNIFSKYNLKCNRTVIECRQRRTERSSFNS